VTYRADYFLTENAFVYAKVQKKVGTENSDAKGGGAAAGSNTPTPENTPENSPENSTNKPPDEDEKKRFYSRI